MVAQALIWVWIGHSYVGFRAAFFVRLSSGKSRASCKKCQQPFRMSVLAHHAQQGVLEHAATQERLELLAHVRGQAFGLAPQDPGWRGTATAVGPNHRASHKSRDGYSKPFAKISPLLPSIFAMNTSEPPFDVMSGPTSVWNVAAVEEVVPTT